MKLVIAFMEHTIPRRSFKIGRGPECEVVLNDPLALPVHVVVKIRRRGDAMVAVLDCNGAVLVDETPYTSGDVRAGSTIVVGDTRIVVAEIPAPDGAWWNPRTWGGGNGEIVVAPTRPAMNPPAQQPPPQTVPIPIPIIPPPTMNPPPPVMNPPPMAPRPPLLPPWVPTDAMEASLFGPLVKNPADEAARLVYADWLEENGETPRAAIVRGGADHAGDPTWRAVVSCKQIVGCAELTCPKQWDKLAMTDDARARSCKTCGQEVYYANDDASERWVLWRPKRHVRD